MNVEVKFNLDLDVEEDKEKFKELSGDDHSNLKIAINVFAFEVLRKYRKYDGFREAVDAYIKETYHPDEDVKIDPLREAVAFIEKKFYETLKEYDAKID